jgi:hypothetical protein
LHEQLQRLSRAGLVTRSESGDWLLCRDLETVSLVELYKAGGYYLPVDESLDIPSKGKWDAAFLASVKLGELNMTQSLKSMYSEPENKE